MSRSRKKPIVKDNPKGMREIANRKLRRAVKSAIRRESDIMPEADEVMNPYDVCDYIIHAWDDETKQKLKRK